MTERTPRLSNVVRICLALGFLVLGGLGCSGDDDDDDSSPTLLVSDSDAVLLVQVVQDVDPDAPTPTVESVEIHNLSGDYVVAVAKASPRVVPIAFGEPDADPSKDFMLVGVQIETGFINDIPHVELNVDVGSDGSIDWCEPMDPDPVVSGSFAIKLQPSCTDDERDPLTGQCVIFGACEGYSTGCREDRLTFTLWNDISSGCHEASDTD